MPAICLFARIQILFHFPSNHSSKQENNKQKKKTAPIQLFFILQKETQGWRPKCGAPLHQPHHLA
jgi:hypothetical protein